MDEKSNLKDELVEEFKQEPELLDMTPLESIKSLVRQALGYDALSPIDLTKHISVALRSSSGQNAIVELKAGSDILSFFAGGEYPVASLNVSIVPVQEGTGDPSPDNVRPITGWTGASVYIAALYGLGPLENYGLTDNGSVSTADTYEHSDYIDLTGVTSVSISFVGGAPGGWIYRVCGYDADKVFVELIDKKNLTDGNYSYTYDVTNYSFLRVSLVDNCKNVVFTGEKNVIPITFPTPPGTVYGGTLDVITGVLSVDMAVSDLGSVSWSKSGTRFFTSGYAAIIENPANNGAVTRGLCDKYASIDYGSAYSGSKNGIAVAATPAGSAGQVSIRDSALEDMTAADFKTYITGAQFVYPLAEPLTFELDPEELSTLVGENNIWADCGPVESITY